MIMDKPSCITDFFEATDCSLPIPLSKVVLRTVFEDVDPDKFKKAGELMDAAKSGVGPKRPPVRVRDLGNGFYKIVDGNTTYHQLMRRGALCIEVEIKE